MSKVPVTYEYLCNLATHARRVGTLDVFADVALQWAGLAEKEIGRLTANIKKANDQAEHFEREWYLRGDEIERLRAERDDNAWWRKELADKLHDRETQISNAWAALRAAGVQSETNLADAIALLAKEQT